MDTDQIIEALQQERNRIDAAITALDGGKSQPSNGRRRPSKMSAAARARISAAQKKRWAAQRKAEKKAA